MDFIQGPWTEQINVTDFVKRNITPYEGDASFLVGPTERTRKLWTSALTAPLRVSSSGCLSSSGAALALGDMWVPYYSFPLLNDQQVPCPVGSFPPPLEGVQSPEANLP